MTRDVEFGSKAVADGFRDRHQEHLAETDDARLKTVRFATDAPEHVVEDAHLAAEEERAETAGSAGQVDLTDSERERIDFSRGRASVPHARSVKAIARAEGVDDWLSFYDHQLTVDEHREVMERAARDERGQRMDAEDSAVERAGRASKRAQGQRCRHAEGHCEHGDQDACEFLRDVCGFDEDEVDAILGADGDDEIPGRIHGARSQLWRRYQIGLVNAKEAAAAINEINEQYGEELTEFEELGGRRLTKADLSWNPSE